MSSKYGPVLGAGVRQIHYSSSVSSVPTTATCFVSSCGCGRPPGSTVAVPRQPGLSLSAPAPHPEPVARGGSTVAQSTEPRASAPASASAAGRPCCGVPSWQEAGRANASTASRRTPR